MSLVSKRSYKSSSQLPASCHLYGCEAWIACWHKNPEMFAVCDIRGVWHFRDDFREISIVTEAREQLSILTVYIIYHCIFPMVLSLIIIVCITLAVLYSVPCNIMFANLPKPETPAPDHDFDSNVSAHRWDEGCHDVACMACWSEKKAVI